MLGVRINIRDDKKNRHTHHQVKYELIIFVLIFVNKDKIKDSQNHIWKPQQVWDDEIFAEWNPVIKNSEYNVVSMNRPLLKVSEQQDINNGISQNYKTMLIFIIKFNQNFTFLINKMHD